MGSNAISFTQDESYKENAVYFQNQGDPNEIVISKKDKKHVVGERLYVEYKGMKIYTSLDNIILINKKNDTIQIIPYKELSPVEEREYLILLSFYEDSESADRCVYQGVQGRQEAFDFLTTVIEEVDMEKSLILAETTSLKDAINVKKFIEMCINDELVEVGEGFDLEDYV